MWYHRTKQQPGQAPVQAIDRSVGHRGARRATELAAAVLLASWLAVCAAPTGVAQQGSASPPGFVHRHAVAPDVQQDMRYYGSNNVCVRPTHLESDEWAVMQPT